MTSHLKENVAVKLGDPRSSINALEVGKSSFESVYLFCLVVSLPFEVRILLFSDFLHSA